MLSFYGTCSFYILERPKSIGCRDIFLKNHICMFGKEDSFRVLSVKSKTNLSMLTFSMPRKRAHFYGKSLSAQYCYHNFCYFSLHSKQITVSCSLFVLGTKLGLHNTYCL